MPNKPVLDVLICGGTVIDGTGKAPFRGDVAIKDGNVVEAAPRIEGDAARIIDAAGCWVTPGFYDLHTHYDAEVEVLPGLDESLRHGVTTVVMGNCSLSAALGSETELLDLFCRVESLPREVMARWLGGKVTWSSPAAYYDHLDTLALGPNVTSFLGHSNVRMEAMGLKRSLEVPDASSAELAKMDSLVREALEAGFAGVSIDFLPFHRMDGDAFRGMPVPSQRAGVPEHRRVAGLVREYGRVLQATPNAMDPMTVVRLLALSAGVGRKPLKTTVIAAMDVKTDRTVHKLAPGLARTCNGIMNGDFRWQTLAEPFLNFCDGVHTPLFEEFPTGIEAISCATEAERKALFAETGYRRRFRKEWTARGRRVFHRDLADMWIVSSPEPAHAGKSFAQVAQDERKDPLECFLDWMAEHGSAVRWKTVVSNDRPEPRLALFASPQTLPGFNDSGAHNRNMAYHDGALQMLKQVAADNGKHLSVEAAVHKLTLGIAEWLGLPGGGLRKGDKADVVVIDPEKLQTGLGEPVEQYPAALGGAMRLVKRSDGVVRHVFVGGQAVYGEGKFAADLGRKKYGKLLRALT